MNAASCECIEIDRQRCHEGLAFAGAHLCDLAVMQSRAADDLHIIVAQPDRAFGRLAHGREGCRHDLIQYVLLGFAEFLFVFDPLGCRRDARLELIRFCEQRLITERLVFRLQPIDLYHQILILFDCLFCGVATE
jgi:hypothetical protein